METFPISHILRYIPEKSKDKIIPCAHGLGMLLKVSQALFFFHIKFSLILREFRIMHPNPAHFPVLPCPPYTLVASPTPIKILKIK